MRAMPDNNTLALHLIYTGTALWLSRVIYPDWQAIQAAYPDYLTSLGPWSAEAMRDYLRDEYPEFPAAQVDDWLHRLSQGAMVLELR